MNTYHPVAEHFDVMMKVVVKVAVCGAIIRYRRLAIMGKGQNAKTTYSNAFDPLARHWKTEEAALRCVDHAQEEVKFSFGVSMGPSTVNAMHCTDGASCGDRVNE